MCKRYRNDLQAADLIDHIRSVDIPLRLDSDALTARRVTGDIFPTDSAMVLKSNGELVMMQWGFPTSRGPVVSVRDDTASYPRAQRGLTPFTSYYEDTSRADGGEWWELTPTLAVSGCPLMFAVALREDGYFSLITTDAGDDIRALKDRQPVILTKEQWPAWLKGSTALFKPSPPGMWTASPTRFA